MPGPPRPPPRLPSTTASSPPSPGEEPLDPSPSAPTPASAAPSTLLHATPPLCFLVHHSSRRSAATWASCGPHRLPARVCPLLVSCQGPSSSRQWCPSWLYSADTLLLLRRLPPFVDRQDPRPFVLLRLDASSSSTTCVRLRGFAKYTTGKTTRMLGRVPYETPSTTTTIDMYLYTASKRRVPRRRPQVTRIRQVPIRNERVPLLPRPSQERLLPLHCTKPEPSRLNASKV